MGSPTEQGIRPAGNQRPNRRVPAWRGVNSLAIAKGQLRCATCRIALATNKTDSFLLSSRRHHPPIENYPFISLSLRRNRPVHLPLPNLYTTGPMKFLTGLGDLSLVPTILLSFGLCFLLIHAADLHNHVARIFVAAVLVTSTLPDAPE